MKNRTIGHIEIPAKGRADLGKFYAEMFGWTIQPMDDKGAKYTVWQAGNMRGGFPDVDKDNQPGDVIIYIDSDDIEADLKKAKSLGAKIVREKSEIPNVGWWGVFKDPTGNTIALFTSMNPANH